MPGRRPGIAEERAAGGHGRALAQREALTRQGWESEDDARLAYLPWVRWMLDSGRYPMLSRYVVEGSNEDDADWQFEFGLKCLLDGISARLGI